MHNCRVNPKAQFSEFRASIRRILMDKWDPIGVKDVPQAADEYDNYIDGVDELLRHKATDRELSEYLIRIETERMGLSDASEKPLLPSVLREAAIRELQSLGEKLPATSPQSPKGFRHWKLFSKHVSPAFAKTQERRRQGVCIACGRKPCQCAKPNRNTP
jgi:hypothetical protein